MAVTREKKEEILESLKKVLSGHESIVFVNFHGLGVSDTTDLRRALREKGVGYTVAKKTLANMALKASSAKGEVPELGGELAIAYGAETTPAGEIYSFSKKHEGKLSILGGIFDGEFLSSDEMMKIATIPSLDALRGMFVNLINSPIQRLAIALDQIARARSRQATSGQVPAGQVPGH